MERLDKILVIRFSSLGDVLLATSFVRALKNRLPESRLDFFTKPAFSPLLENNPHINKVVELSSGGFSELRRQVAELKSSGGYDLVLDIHDSLRSRYIGMSGLGRASGRARKNRIKRLLLIKAGIDLYGPNPTPMPERYFGAAQGFFDPPLEPDGKGAELFIADKYRDEARAAMGDDAGYMTVAPSANWSTKRWTPEGFAAVGDEISRRSGAKVVLLGDGKDRELAEKVSGMMKSRPLNLAGKLSIMGTAAVIERARLFIGNDTGLMHIAGALNVPGVAVFGPTTQQLGFFPYRSTIEVVENHALKCRPCTKQGKRECPRNHFLCMKDIPAETVIEKALTLIKR